MATDYYDPEAIDLTSVKDLTIEELVRKYLEVRDVLDVERKKYNAFEATSKDILSRLSMAMRDKADALGVDSFSTSFATAYRSTKESYRVGNWEAIVEFIKSTGNYQMLERRVAKLATKEIHESLGEVPPGVEYFAEQEFLVRRKGARD